MTYTKKELIDALKEFYDKSGEISYKYYEEKEGNPKGATYRVRFGSWGNAIDAAGIPHDIPKCRECGNLYDGIGYHWRFNPSHRPEVTEHQHDILTGFLMGDGSLGYHDRKNSYFQSNMTNKSFLRWLDREIGVLSRGYYLYRNPEESAYELKRSGFHETAKPSSCKPIYRWESRSHPEFNRYTDWYSTGQKRFPKDLELTPTILKVWFCCDGNRKKQRKRKYRSYLRISCNNELDRTEKLENIFDSTNIDVKPRFEISNCGRDRKKNLSICFSADDSEKLWDWMGKPLPGFDYKWPD